MDREWPASCSSFILHVMEHARTQLMHVHITIWSAHARRRSKQPRSARIHLGAHICRHTHVARSPSPAPWLPSGWFVSRDPGYSARLNKSHQVGSDSSHVDGAPNVIWRLGEHEIGPSSASSDTLSRCDVVLSLDASVLSLYLSFFFVTHTHTHTHSHPRKTIQKHTVPADILSFCAKRGPSVQPPTPPPTYTPSACLFCSSCSISPPHTRDPSCHCSHCHASTPEKLPTHFLPVTHAHTSAQLRAHEW